MRRTIAALIVKNEEALLARCLDSIKDIVDSIWILDTGSRDDTVSICRKYTENTFIDFVWTDSFCDAQNFLLEKIRGKSDFILSIDADECLLNSREEIHEAIEKATDTVRVTMISEHDKNSFGFARIFRNTPDIYWEQDIHKHLNLPGEGEEVGDIKIMYG